MKRGAAQLARAAVLSQYNKRGAGVKDIRLLNRIATTIDTATGPVPQEKTLTPEMPDEEKMAITNYNRSEYLEHLHNWRQEPVQVTLDDTIAGIVKDKVTSFDGYPTDDLWRPMAVELLDAFGVDQ